MTSQIHTTWMSLTDIMQNKRLDTKELRIPCSLTRGKTDPTSSDRKRRDEVGTGPRELLLRGGHILYHDCDGAHTVFTLKETNHTCKMWVLAASKR